MRVALVLIKFYDGPKEQKFLWNNCLPFGQRITWALRALPLNFCFALLFGFSCYEFKRNSIGTSPRANSANSCDPGRTDIERRLNSVRRLEL